MFPASHSITQISQEKERLDGKKSFQYDFLAGDFVQKDGSVSSTEEWRAVKVWVEKVLRTEKNRYPIYDKYGVPLLELVNSNYPQSFKEAEIKREIQEALYRNPEITSVESFSFERERHRLVCYFTVRTIYGVAFESWVSL